MTPCEIMAQAYLEAVDFTETGDTGQPAGGTELTPLFKAQVWIACRNFLEASSGLTSKTDANLKQLGHDLWLTRNGHGTGFWDRPEIYGEANADLFSRLARAMGEHDADFIQGDQS